MHTKHNHFCQCPQKTKMEFEQFACSHFAMSYCPHCCPEDHAYEILPTAECFGIKPSATTYIQMRSFYVTTKKKHPIDAEPCHHQHTSYLLRLLRLQRTLRGAVRALNRLAGHFFFNSPLSGQSRKQVEFFTVSSSNTPENRFQENR